jgi:pimeloyl-ACP methyl ester carboxylesterase
MNNQQARNSAFPWRGHVLIRFAVCSLALWLPLEASAQETKSQSWVGGIAAGGFVGITLTISEQAAGKTATLDFVNQGPERQNLPVRELSVEGGRLRLKWDEPDGIAMLEGSQKIVDGEEVIEGVFTQGKQTGPFFLTRGATIPRAVIAKDFGLFATSTNGLLWLGPVSELNRRPAFVDVQTGRLGALYPRKSNQYISGPTALVPFPADVTLTVTERDTTGRAMKILVARRGRAATVAERKDVYDVENVVFTNDTVKLAGSVITPKGKGPWPAVVFIHGSGGSTREYFSSLPYLLASRGVASLIYDKRGSGESTGNRHISPFEMLADDALAGVHLLRSRADIDSTRIGVYGHSQGGWVAPLAAFRSRGKVAFVVAVAGPADDFQRQTNDEIENNVRALSIGEDAVQKALEYQDLWWRVYRHRAPYGDLATLTAQSKTEAWYPYTFGLKSEANFTMDPPGAYDPAPVLQNLRVPILAVYGESDNRVLARKNAVRMRSALKLAGNRDVTVKLFPNADHDMIIAAGKGSDGYLARSRYADGYLEYLVRWIVDHTKATRTNRPID